jgi:ubiquinone/menaquinone biosynthesis C-methylase UbiE
MWNSGWDKLFKRKTWGKYPCEELVRYIFNNFKKKKSNIKILELGCGTGANIFFLAKEGFSTFGIDGSKTALKIAEKYLKSEKLKAKLSHGDIIKLPYKSNYFDCVIDVECIYSNSLNDTTKILNETVRVLKKRGLFFSKTFSTGISGQKSGIPIDKEKFTFLKLPNSPLQADYGLIRLTDEKDLKKIYSMFGEITYDYIIRTQNNRKDLIKEWLVKARKI